MKGKSSINLTSLVEFEHHSMADTIRNENEEKKIKVKASVMTEKNKCTKLQTKISLSCFDDKRYITEDGISTLAHGHYLIEQY